MTSDGHSTSPLFSTFRHTYPVHVTIKPAQNFCLYKGVKCFCILYHDRCRNEYSVVALNLLKDFGDDADDRQARWLYFLGRVVAFKGVEGDRYAVWCVQALSRANFQVELRADLLARQIG